MRSTFQVRMTCGCRGLSISFTNRRFVLVVSVVTLGCVDERLNNQAGFSHVALRNQNLHSSDTTYRRSVGGEPADELVFKESLDAFSIQYTLEKISLGNVAGVNDQNLFLASLSQGYYKGP